MNKTIYFHYVVLIAILTIGIIAFYYVQPSHSAQLTVGIITSCAYIVWGIIHHALKHELHQKIVIEYILIGMIAVVLLATVLKS
jgi:uncharacterized membrane protein